MIYFDKESYNEDEIAKMTVDITGGVNLVLDVPARNIPTVTRVIEEPPPVLLQKVRGGYYKGSNGDPRTDLATGTNLRSFQQYHSFAENGPSQFPGWQKPFVTELLGQGVALNLVLELKSYGNAAPQSFTVEGRSYGVPAMNGQFQLGSNTSTSGVPFYSYSQITSGACDGLIHRSLAALRNVPAGSWVNVQLASEVDTDNQYGIMDGSTKVPALTADSQAVAAYSYIIDWMRNPPAGIAPLPGNVTFSMGWAGQWSESGTPGRFAAAHPDSLPVDYAMCNMYNHGQDWSAEDRLRENVDLIGTAGPRIRSLPIIIAEWGSSENWLGGQAGYMHEMSEALPLVQQQLADAERGQIAVMNWFGSRDSTWGKFPADPTASKNALLDLYATDIFQA